VGKYETTDDDVEASVVRLDAQNVTSTTSFRARVIAVYLQRGIM
jgi:hypothetical protein